MKKIAFLYLLILPFISFGQEAEYYRFSFDYFVGEIKKENINRDYYLKSDKGWIKVSSKSIDEKNINKTIDWKIVENGKHDQGAFSEGGVYSVTKDTTYEELKRNWMHQYYRPIWEIRVRELGLTIKYDASKAGVVKTSGKVFDITENSAEFAAGQMNLMRYFSKSIILPKDLDNYNGTSIFVQFIILENGKIAEANIIRGFNKEIDKEVIRVIEGMPNWIPARQRGKCVTSRLILPIKIALK